MACFSHVAFYLVVVGLKKKSGLCFILFFILFYIMSLFWALVLQYSPNTSRTVAAARHAVTIISDMYTSKSVYCLRR